MPRYLIDRTVANGPAIRADDPGGRRRRRSVIGAVTVICALVAISLTPMTSAAADDFREQLGDQPDPPDVR